jgi:hypothetical protein
MTQEGKAISRSGALHASAAATVLLFAYHVAGRGLFLVGFPC